MTDDARTPEPTPIPRIWPDQRVDANTLCWYRSSEDGEIRPAVLDGVRLSGATIIPLVGPEANTACFARELALAPRVGILLTRSGIPHEPSAPAGELTAARRAWRHLLLEAIQRWPTVQAAPALVCDALAAFWYAVTWHPIARDRCWSIRLIRVHLTEHERRWACRALWRTVPEPPAPDALVARIADHIRQAGLTGEAADDFRVDAHLARDREVPPPPPGA